MSLVKRAIKKANNSDCNYKVSAIGLSKKGNVLGIVTNTHRFDGKGRGLHAEHRLIRRYGRKISTIIIFRVGKGGALRPIHPCDNCQKIADKLNIKIISFEENKCIQ